MLGLEWGRVDLERQMVYLRVTDPVYAHLSPENARSAVEAISGVPISRYISR